MKKTKNALLLVLSTSLLSVGCTTAPPSIQTGPDAELSFDGLHVVDNSRADKAWARPDFDMSAYSKVMLVGMGIEYAPAKNSGRTSMDRSRTGPFIISEDTRTRFEALVQETFQEEFAEIENFEIVSEAGPDVLMVRGGLLDVESFVPEEAMNRAGRGGIYLQSIGEATIFLELRDSESGAILARSIDRRAAEPIGDTMMEANRVTNTTEVKRLVRYWARGLRQALDGFAQP